MDIATLIGFFGGLVVLAYAVISGGQGFGCYWDLPSVLITCLGTVAAVMISFPMADIKNVPKLMNKTFKSQISDPNKIISDLIDLANKARKDGLLSLEEAGRNLDDEFLKKGLMLIVDGTDPELVRNLLETELDFIEERHKKSKGILESFASLAPGFGMIGTLFGLIAMLQSMSDPSSIGPSMSVALITTLYGSLMANFIFTPMANKLGANSAIEMLERSIILEGLLSIQAGENPRIIEEKLKAFLPTSLRNKAEREGE